MTDEKNIENELRKFKMVSSRKQDISNFKLGWVYEVTQAHDRTFIGDDYTEYSALGTYVTKEEALLGIEKIQIETYVSNSCIVIFEVPAIIDVETGRFYSLPEKSKKFDQATQEGNDKLRIEKAKRKEAMLLESARKKLTSEELEAILKTNTQN